MTVLAYCWPQSVVAGEPVSLHLSAPGGAAETAVEVVRDGAEPETVWRAGSVPVDPLPVPGDAPEAGCGWPSVLTIPTSVGWSSGCYVVRTGDDPPSAFFVLRPDAPTPGAPLLKLATNTWNAYNDAGGLNLYTGAVHASAERPLAAGFLAKPAEAGERVVEDVDSYIAYTGDHDLSMWHGMAGWAGQERRFALWAERAGITLDYATDADLDRPDAAELLDQHRLLLSIGHDEYWTWAMRDAVEGFVAGGGNVAFLSGNTCYWQVRLEDDARRMVAWKHRFAEDPVHGTDQQHLTTTIWADPVVGRPEAALTGVSFTRGGYHRVHRSVPAGAAGYEVHRPEHWLLEGTGLERGDLLGADRGVVGYECDGCELTLVGGLPVPTGTDGTPPGFTVVATAPATPFEEHNTPLPLAPGGEYELPFHARRLLGDDSPASRDRLRAGCAVLGTWTGGGTVVTTGCTDWAHGLDDPTVDRVTRTILGTLS
jgi:hypothetical protein